MNTEDKLPIVVFYPAWLKAISWFGVPALTFDALRRMVSGLAMTHLVYMALSLSAVIIRYCLFSFPYRARLASLGLTRPMVRQFALLLLAALLARCGASVAGPCRELTLDAVVSGNAEYRKDIGMGLQFRLVRDEDYHGWEFEIGSTAPTKEGLDRFVYALTPPWRGRHTTMLHTAYGTSAQDAVAPEPHVFWFLVGRDDAEIASRALDNILWPPSDAAHEQALNKLGSLPKGAGLLRVVSAEVEPARNPVVPATAEPDFGKVLALHVEVALVVPANFRPAPGMRVRSAACPNLKLWPDGPA